MRLESARDLKDELLGTLVVPLAELASGRPRSFATLAPATTRAMRGTGLSLEASATTFGVGARTAGTVPQVQRSIALGVSPHEQQYRLAVRVQRQALMASSLVEHIVQKARGEADVRMIGRIDKRARPSRARGGASAAVVAWYRADNRPLLIGSSVGHVLITAGTIGAFVTRGSKVHILSNNHVLANENQASVGDWILQRAHFDGGREPVDRVAKLRFSVGLKVRGANIIDGALAELKAGIAHDPTLLRGLVNLRDRRLAGVGPEFIDAGEAVYKVGRTTGATKGRVTAFDLDNVIVNYDIGNLRFDNQIEFEGDGNRPFSDGGDSGSLIVNGGMQAIALLFAGGDTGGSNGLGLTYGNPMVRVLKDLKASLLF